MKIKELNFGKCDYAKNISNGICSVTRYKCDGNCKMNFYDFFKPVEDKDICKIGSELDGNLRILLTKESIKTLERGGTIEGLCDDVHIFIRFDDDLINK